MDDLALINNTLNGDEKAFEILLLKYHLEIKKYVYSNIGDDEVTKDIVQDIFISVYNKLYTFKRDCKFRTWLYTITRNKCIDYMRKSRIDVVDIETSINLVVSKEPSPHERAEFKETKERVNDFINTLDKTNKDIIYLKYYHEDMTFYDISCILGISESAVKSRYYSLYKKYIKHLKRSGESWGEKYEVR